MSRKPAKLPFVMPVWSEKACKTYWYFRHKLIGRVPLKGVPGTTAFMAEYHACLERVRDRTSTIGARRNPAGTTQAIVAAYLRSDEFGKLAETTQYERRSRLLKFADSFANDQLGDLAAADLARIFAAKPITMQHAWRKILTGLFAFAIDAKLVKANPAAEWKLERAPESTGSQTWEEEHVKAYRKRWASGTRERMALELLINTAARGGSDVVRLGRQNMKGDGLHFRASKNGATVTVPILPTLADEIALVPAGQMLFLATGRGGQMGGGGKSGNSTWGKFFRDACKAAEIPDGYTAHGIRKYTAVQLTYAGCSDQEILSVLGDSDTKMLRVYTAAAREEIKARNAFARLKAHRDGGAEIVQIGARA